MLFGFLSLQLAYLQFPELIVCVKVAPLLAEIFLPALPSLVRGLPLTLENQAMAYYFSVEVSDQLL